jgi:serine/threonine-protein kinase
MTGRLLDGRYQIGARIARGGMASVYEAVDVRLERTVAVKVMHPGVGNDDELAARFVREARAAARLSHPNVVAVFDQGNDHGDAFLAMELVDGITLRDLVRKESPMAPARALTLMEPVLSALASAHRAGLVHRDVKPENVLIATDPDSGSMRIKVADFGLARAVSADTQHTATGGVLIGTVSYLAPELVIDGRADARADVYAAGVVLFELLTGAKPHEGETPIQIAYKHVHEDVPATSSVVPDIPAYVDALVARASARDRGIRPADAGVLLHQLHRVSHALAEGVVDDAELTADLTPTRVHVAPEELSAPDDAGAEHTTPIQTLSAHQPAPPRHTPPTRPTPTDPPPRRPRRSRRGLVLLIVALFLASAAGVGAWWFGFARYTSTPGVLGMSKVAAARTLHDAGLGVTWADGAYSETVPAGRVVGTNPDPGSRVLDGGTVTVTMSLGKERYDVPKLAGKSVDEAQDALAATHLAYGTSVERWSDDVKAGNVIGTRPKAGTTLRPDAAVDLIVSKGPRPIRVRDWTGKSAKAARAWFERRGLEVDAASEEFSDTVDEGDVISQDPVDGTLHRGDQVSLVVSKGPELIEVPSVRGQGVDAATARLEELGFKVEVEKAAGDLGLGYVWSQDPGSGEEIPKGSTITLFLI